MRRLLAAGVVFVSALAPAAIADARLPRVLTQLKPEFQIRPAVISYTGDGTGLVGGPDGTSVSHLGRLDWTTYTHRRGVAHGLLWLNDCAPGCATGHFHSTPVTVYVGSPARGRFRHLTLSYTYQGKHYTDRRRIQGHGCGRGCQGYWAYEIVG